MDAGDEVKVAAGVVEEVDGVTVLVGVAAEVVEEGRVVAGEAGVEQMGIAQGDFPLRVPVAILHLVSAMEIVIFTNQGYDSSMGRGCSQDSLMSS